MKAKVISGLVIVKRTLLVGLTLWALSTGWKLVMLQQRGRTLAAASAKMLELRLSLIEEKMASAAGVFDNIPRKALPRGVKTQPLPPQAKPVLSGLLAASSYMDEVGWIGGTTKNKLFFSRQGNVIQEKAFNATSQDSPLYEAHHKGTVVISPLEYSPQSIPVFHMSFPLNGQEGGLLLARVNLWEFLKMPTAMVSDMLGDSFDFEIRDSAGKLLAHRLSPPDPLARLVTRFFTGQDGLQRLDFRLKTIPTRKALLETLKPGRLAWWCLGIAIFLCFLL